MLKSEDSAISFPNNMKMRGKRSFVDDSNETKYQSHEPNKERGHSQKKLRYDKRNYTNDQNRNDSLPAGFREQKDKSRRDSNIQASIVYYEKILQSLRQELSMDSKDMFAINALKESEGKEVELSFHAISSHCLELLLTECKDAEIMQRFMSAYAEEKIPVCTSANASHITEILIQYAVKAIQNWPIVLDSEESEEKDFVSFCLNWLCEFGDFVLENLNDCLSNPYSCHVVCTLVRALAGDLSEVKGSMSKNLKGHKQKFRSQYIEESSSTKYQETNPVVLEKIPKFFSKALKKLYKSLVKSENVLDYVVDSSSATVIEALLFALKKRHPKACKKMISKLALLLFSDKNKDGVPSALLHPNSSYIVDEIFKAAPDESKLALWNQYIVGCLEALVTHSIGNFIIQRIFDVVQDKAVLEAICESTWSVFDEIRMSRNFGIFVSLAAACNRLSAQQAPFMKNIMLCLHCFEPENRQNLLLPLLLGIQTYEDYSSSQNRLSICLQGSLIAQHILKFHKPIKVVQSILNMSPADIEFLAGHIQGCHVLNSFFGSISVGEKNKEKLLHHLKPVMISIVCDRNKSLTLSRIWVLLSLKLKEVIARELSRNKKVIGNDSNGSIILKKFGIYHFENLPKWRELQASITFNKKIGKP